MKLDGALALRGNEPVGGYCPMERALRVIGTRSAVMLLREAFYGATRFDDFTARTGLTDRTTAARLRDFERVGILERRAYREPGQRQRHEYVLTDAGTGLMPAVFALLQWANEHDPPPYPPEVRHDGCGEHVRIVAECDAGHRVTADELVVSAPGPFGLDAPVSIESWDSEQPAARGR
jgi:DNA-binding HxlR family transcriptional regulator